MIELTGSKKDRQSQCTNEETGRVAGSWQCAGGQWSIEEDSKESRKVYSQGIHSHDQESDP